MISHADFKQDILNDLLKTPKNINSKWLYDKRGSDLFNQICDLTEYYLTRAETEILIFQVNEIKQLIGTKALLIE